MRKENILKGIQSAFNIAEKGAEFKRSSRIVVLLLAGLWVWAIWTQVVVKPISPDEGLYVTVDGDIRYTPFYRDNFESTSKYLFTRAYLLVDLQFILMSNYITGTVGCPRITIVILRLILLLFAMSSIVMVYQVASGTRSCNPMTAALLLAFNPLFLHSINDLRQTGVIWLNTAALFALWREWQGRKGLALLAFSSVLVIYWQFTDIAPVVMGIICLLYLKRNDRCFIRRFQKFAVIFFVLVLPYLVNLSFMVWDGISDYRSASSSSAQKNTFVAADIIEGLISSVEMTGGVFMGKQRWDRRDAYGALIVGLAVIMLFFYSWRRNEQQPLLSMIHFVLGSGVIFLSIMMIVARIFLGASFFEAYRMSSFLPYICIVFAHVFASARRQFYTVILPLIIILCVGFTDVIFSRYLWSMGGEEFGNTVQQYSEMGHDFPVLTNTFSPSLVPGMVVDGSLDRKRRLFWYNRHSITEIIESIEKIRVRKGGIWVPSGILMPLSLEYDGVSWVKRQHRNQFTHGLYEKKHLIIEYLDNELVLSRNYTITRGSGDGLELRLYVCRDYLDRQPELLAKPVSDIVLEVKQWPFRYSRNVYVSSHGSSLLGHDEYDTLSRENGSYENSSCENSSYFWRVSAEFDDADFNQEDLLLKYRVYSFGFDMWAGKILDRTRNIPVIGAVFRITPHISFAHRLNGPLWITVTDSPFWSLITGAALLWLLTGRFIALFVAVITRKLHKYLKNRLKFRG